MPIITARKDEIINALIKNELFTSRNANSLSLHTSDPGQDGSNEVTGGDYARKTIPWAESSSLASITTTDDIEFDGMPEVTVSHVTVWDSSVPIWTGTLSSSIAVSAGSTFRISSGELTAAINDS